MSKKRKYSDEFKRESVDLLRKSGKKSIEVANELGISRDNLLRWRKEIETIERESPLIL